ncbi:hypothetical protein CNMCM6805_000524 [Aspergillus fumigatiaffinis]|uniref:Uncharacterized protein n=1 Tax=Aspergillus fumigatiaffinis TaxID=340414 RepID=A0A8H4H084_9EURO|nr:hypothetical protein CNMCM6805_000524 [Aspergillus fumigatiaffinis]KAF4231778.1 hypothetical protein CNMCM6457_005077 [Aspergillus fumigatiaffinis]
MAPTWRFRPTPTFILITSLLFFLVLGTHFRLWSKNDANHGEPNPPVSTEVAGIGIDLTGFYGTAAVSFPNGTVVNIGRVEGSSHYEEAVRRLSLHSSTHLHPPYVKPPEQFQDLPRRKLRSFRKWLGLPASGDVGALAAMIRELKIQVEDALSVHLATLPIVISTPHLIALYEEDIHDAFEYLNLPFPEDIHHRRSWAWVRDTGAALAGYGHFLCSDYRHYEACESEIDAMPLASVISILYTKSAVKVLRATVKSAHIVIGFWDNEDQWTLGYASREEEGYWDRLALRLMDWKRKYPGSGMPDRVVLFGESAADKTFRSVVEKVFIQEFGSVPQILGGTDEYVAARGAAEFARLSVFGIHR